MYIKHFGLSNDILKRIIINFFWGKGFKFSIYPMLNDYDEEINEDYFDVELKKQYSKIVFNTDDGQDNFVIVSNYLEEDSIIDQNPNALFLDSNNGLRPTSYTPSRLEFYIDFPILKKILEDFITSDRKLILIFANSFKNSNLEKSIKRSFREIADHEEAMECHLLNFGKSALIMFSKKTVETEVINELRNLVFPNLDLLEETEDIEYRFRKLIF